jgi:hypothetical protein
LVKRKNKFGPGDGPPADVAEPATDAPVSVAPSALEEGPPEMGPAPEPTPEMHNGPLELAPPAPEDGPEALAPAVTDQPSEPSAALEAPPPDVAEAPAAGPPPEAAVPSLEQRVRRLEDALAMLQDLRRRDAAPVSYPAPQAVVAPQLATGSPVAVVVEAGKRLPTAAQEQVSPSPSAPPVEAPKTSRWLLLDLVAEARAIGRMFVDPRYHLSWWARIMALVLIVGFVTSSLWVPGTSLPGFGFVINKVADLLLGFVLFKVLGREASRYRATAPDLPPNMRL